MPSSINRHWYQKSEAIQNTWHQKERTQEERCGPNSSWWHCRQALQQSDWLKTFCSGQHRFSPLRQFQNQAQEAVICWRYPDRLALHLLYQLIKPTLKHIINPNCYHLQGPSVIPRLCQQITATLSQEPIQYAIRFDVKSYYASIDREILFDLCQQHFDDPQLLSYLEQIIHIPIDVNADIRLPKKGIPRGSSLSPFFGALYLSPLDEAFSRRKCFYYRYQDDILILFANKRQYQQGRKLLYHVLKRLKLREPAHKTKMGRIDRGFHFLGIEFSIQSAAARTAAAESEAGCSNRSHTNQVSIALHPRSYQRARDKAKALNTDAVHPALTQGYVLRWARWWSRVGSLCWRDLMLSWWQSISVADLAIGMCVLPLLMADLSGRVVLLGPLMSA